MKKKYILFLLIISCLFITCTNKSELYFDTNFNYFDVVYNMNDITITEVYKGKTFESHYSLRNGEYIDIPENRVFLSTKQQYRMVIDCNYVDYNKQLWIHIYKLEKRHMSSVVGKNEDIFITEFYTIFHNRKDILRTYYYDKNYKILKILVNESIEYNVNK